VPQRNSRNKTIQLNMTIDKNGKVGKITGNTFHGEEKIYYRNFKK
jgi:hypothetical protein